MRTKIMLGMAGLMAVALAGCSLNSQVPHTTMTAQIGGQTVSLETPKDYQISGLDISVGSNGLATVHIASLNAVMNPTNTTAAGEASAQIISATADAVTKAVSAGAAVAGAAAK